MSNPYGIGSKRVLSISKRSITKMSLVDIIDTFKTKINYI